MQQHSVMIKPASSLCDLLDGEHNEWGLTPQRFHRFYAEWKKEFGLSKGFVKGLRILSV